jgi:CRISPR-associated protein (TIGR02710 family)
MSESRILLCTVGTGDITKPEETLLEPLRKSIRKGKWQRVILLPSQLTAENANRLQAELRELPIEIKPLPMAGIEDDFDACFAHFDRVLEEVRASGVPADSIVFDLTRGTKVMSAALALSAINHDLPTLRYIHGQRDVRGMVQPGTEVVGEFRTTVATARKRLDEAHRFFARGNFAAVLDTLPDPEAQAGAWPIEMLDTVRSVRALAAYYAAWDRLDYKGAHRIVLPTPMPKSSAWSMFYPSLAALQWVADLSQQLPPAAADRALHLRRLAVDLLANGERRLRDHQFEDAIIRAYRVLELVGQIRLCDQGLHSDALPPDNPVVQQFQAELIKGKSEPLGTNKDGTLVAAREKVARLLKRLGDSLAPRLIELGNEGAVKASVRNYSALIHGFEAVSGSEPQPLRELYLKLERLLVDDGGADTGERLKIAKSLNFSKK